MNKFKKRKRQIRRDRTWNHFLYWLSDLKFHSNFTKWVEPYNPEDHRLDFEEYQSHGARNLTAEQIEGIKPLLDGQVSKEITLNLLVEESMEWWAHGAGWTYPFLSFLSFKNDRLTKVAVLRIKKQLQEDNIGFWMRHPGISEDSKQKYLSIYLGADLMLD